MENGTTIASDSETRPKNMKVGGKVYAVVVLVVVVPGVTVEIFCPPVPKRGTR